MKRAKFLTTLAILLGGMSGVAEAPKTWDAKALSDWATPVAGLNVRPGHFSEEEYYRAPVDNFRTYPVSVAGLALAAPHAQQFDTRIANPSFPPKTGPRVVIDAAHFNFAEHTDAFLDVLRNDGFRVS